MTDNHDEIPQLRFQDQTPISNKADNKRLSSTLIPISDDLTQIESTIEKMPLKIFCDKLRYESPTRSIGKTPILHIGNPQLQVVEAASF